MTDARHDACRLNADLVQLRVALRSVEAPAADEAELRAAFRDAQRRRARKAVGERGGGDRRLPLAAAAAVVLAVGAALAAVVLRGDSDSPVLVSAREADRAPEAAEPISAFQPLLSSPGLPSASYSVVRVRIPLSAFAVVPGTAQEGTIEADLLVGEDGLARAIRFDEADVARVSVAGR
jgi:hypothetical protein